MLNQQNDEWSEHEHCKQKLPEFIQSDSSILSDMEQIGNVQETKEVIAEMEMQKKGMMDSEKSKARESLNEVAMALHQRFPKDRLDIYDISNAMLPSFTTTDPQTQTEPTMWLVFITLLKIKKSRARLCCVWAVLKRMNTEKITQTNF